MDIELQSIQRYGACLLDHIQIDNYCALELEGLEVGFQSNVVVFGHNICGQDLSTLGHIHTAGLDVSLSLGSTHLVVSVRAVSDSCSCGGTVSTGCGSLWSSARGVESGMSF